MSEHKKGSALSALVVFGLIFALIFGMHTVNRRLAKEERGAGQASMVVQADRSVELDFMTTNMQASPLLFYPEKNTLMVHPGQAARAYFYLENSSDQPQTFFSVASSAPRRLAAYLVRLDDFSAKNITVPAGQTVKLAVDVLVDPKLPTAAKLLTLNYSWYPGRDH